MRRYQPPALPGWGPMTAPPRTPNLWPRVVREVAILAALTFVASRLGLLGSPKGWLVVLLARAILDLLINHRHDLGLPAVKFAVVGALAAVLITTVPTAPHVTAKAPELKAPVRVEASQADYLKQARDIWAAAYAKLIAQGASKVKEQP